MTWLRHWLCGLLGHDLAPDGLYVPGRGLVPVERCIWCGRLRSVDGVRPVRWS